MQAIDRIREKAKISTIVKTVANIFLIVITSFFRGFLSNNDIIFSSLFNSLSKTITFSPQNFWLKILRLIKKDNASTIKKISI